MREVVSTEDFEEEDVADAVSKAKLISARGAFEPAVVQVVTRGRSRKIRDACGRMLYSMHGLGLASTLEREAAVSRYGNVR